MEDEGAREDKISMLAEISGLSRDAARDALSICDYNFNAAVNILFDDQTADESTSTSNAISTTSTQQSEEDDCIIEEFVRDPIPPKRETLVTPDGDNFQSRRRRVISSRAICPLRNFELEGRLQEQQMEALARPHGESRGHKRAASTSSAGMFVRSTIKRSRLEYLYRPPVDICFSGSLQAARDYAQMRNRWLIVNLQDNTDFKCQILNRDIWSNEKVRCILQDHFVFWQVAIDNSEGMRFQSFYKVQEFPFVGILDPTTGEKKINFESGTQLEEKLFRKELLSFLTLSNNHPTNAAVPVVTTTKPKISTITSGSEPISLTEEEQIALAIANSLRESEDSSHSSHEQDEATATSEPRIKSDSDEQQDANNTDYEQLLGCSTDEITRLQLRLPNGERTCLEWPCSTKLLALKRYINHKYPDIPPNDFKIICPFAAKTENNLIIMDNEGLRTLKQADLHPSAILHIQINE